MSSKRRIRRKQCGKKVGYDTKSAAQPAVGYAWFHSRESIHAYHCQHCSKWHVGHKPRVMRQAERARKKAATA